MQKLGTYTNYINFVEKRSYFRIACLIVFSAVFPLLINAQTILERGDIAVFGVNANNAACGGSGGEDVITLVAFKDITDNTEIDITDNGWERLSAGQWGDSEGTYRMTRTGGTIGAGVSFEFTFLNDLAGTQAANPGWTITDLNVPSTLARTVNFNSGGDQLYVMQSGVWDNLGETGEHDADYSGRVLYGFNTRTTWNADGTTQQSNIHPQVDPCYFMNPTSGTTNYVNYSGPTTPTTQLEWIARIGDPSNWTTYSSCTDYNNNLPPAFIDITPSGMSIECAICTGCGTINDVLTFNLPSSGGPFNVMYTDGSGLFILNGISDGHTVNVTVTENTTFSFLSVTDINGCPLFSNFEGEAEITTSGGGGDASITGGGVICTGTCSDITVSITGGQAPYDVTMELDFPPFVNNWQFDVDMPNTSLNMTVCVDGLIPSYDPITNTLTIPDFIGNNVTITLISMDDNSGCSGTVDGTPLNFDIQQTPTANPAGPLQACDDGSGQATFDLTSLDNTVNGGNGNTVNWFSDMATNNPILTPGNYTTVSTIVYATITQGDCDSDPIPVNLNIDASPTPTPPPPTSACDDGSGQATFDLTSFDNLINGGNGNVVTWYFDIGATSTIPNPTTFQTISTTVFATVSAGICESTTVALIITVTPAPTANQTNTDECDDGSGSASFDLTALDITVNGGTANPVSWFEDAAGLIPVFDPLNYVSTGGVVYASVDNGACSSALVPINLILTPGPTATSTNDTQCDDGSGNAFFDLTSLDFTVNGGSGNPVSWYIDDAATTLIPDPSNHPSTGGSVWAVVNNGACGSEAVEIFLIVNPAPSANTTSGSACDDGSGSTIFDLTQFDNDVNGGNGMDVVWYLDPAGTILVPDPTNYNTSGGTVYAAVDNGACLSPVVEVMLSVNPGPTASGTNDQACSDNTGGATFDLTTLDNIINSGTGMTVSWFFDIDGNFIINDPENFFTGVDITVYATVNNGICESATVPINLTITTAPIANTTSEEACDDGSGTVIFDLTLLDNDVNGGNGNPVSWFSDIDGNDPILDPANFVTGSTSVFASISDGICSSEIVEIIITLNEIPTANTTNAEACDEGSGTAAFNLDALESIINGGNGDDVLWYSDADATIPITSPYNTGTTTIYAVVNNGDCQSETVEISLEVSDAVVANPASLDDCDNGNDEATFDLTSIESIVNNGTANPVNWFEDPAATIAIVPPYTSGNTTIYAVVGNGNCASAPVSIDLNVTELPDAAPASLDLCEETNNTATFDLSTLENTVNVGTSNIVTWYEDIDGTTPISTIYISETTVVYAQVDNGTCLSSIIAVALTVNEAPEATTASADACDDGTGTANFNLTDLDGTVGGTNTVTWYEDDAATNEIIDPNNFDSGSASVFAIVTDGDCVSEIVEITLTIENQISANPASADACDDGTGTANFNLTDLDGTVGGTNTVTWYQDAAATTEIIDPNNFDSGNASVFAIVTDGDCTSEIVEITLTIENQISANPASADACDDGTGTANFNLTDLDGTVGGTNTVTWYEDAAATTEIIDPNNFDSGSASVFAIVTDGDCTSEIVEITLTIENQISANPASADACDDGTGIANFNLTDLDGTVGGTNTVTWYEDAAATNEIIDPNNFDSGSASVFAIVTDGDCTSEIVEITLTIENQISANPASADACDDGTGTANFNLTDLDGTVGGTNTVTWYQDAAATNEIIDPNNFDSGSASVFAIVTDGDCVSEIVEITLTIENQISANPASADACDDGTGIANFNLTDLDGTVGGTNTVTWYEDAAATTEIIDPNNFDSGSASVFAIVTDGDCVSEIVEITLTIENQISANPASADACDDGTGTANFNLTDLDGTVGGTNTVTWYEDAAATNEIIDPNNFDSGSASVFAIVTDGDCISEIVEITLTIENQISANPASADACDDGTGIANFNLTDLDGTVGGTNTVTWYQDAAATNEIIDPNNFDSGSASVFAIVTDGDCTSEIVEITLTIENQISANPTSADACDDGTGTANFNLTDLDGTVGGTNTVTWYEDAAATNEIIDPNNFDSGNASVFAIVTDGDCVSEIVEITLTIENQISANPASADACDDGTGIANFNLTDLDGTVGGTNTVTWYQDATATTEIIDPNNFDSGSASVFAIVTDGDCVSEIVEITLTIENQISANPASADACDDGTGTANFNLTDLDGTVGGTNTVTWYQDAAATNEIIDPNNFDSGNASVFAIVTDGDCTSEIVEITLTIENQISANPASADACDDGTGTANFNLTDLDGTVGGTNTVTWYEDAAATNEIIDPNNFDSGNASVFAIVTDGDCTSEIVEITLTIENQISANPASADACDDGTGTANFNLTDLDGTVGGTNTVTWYQDATATTEIIDPNNFDSGNASVFAIVTDGDCVSEIVEITLTIENQISANPASADACDDGTGTANFNLTDLDGTVGGTNTVTWYEDAAATNEIIDPNNFDSGNASVFAIVTDGDCVSEIVEITLTIENQISATPASDQACDDGTGTANFNLTDLDGTVGGTNTVTWYQDATATTEIIDPNNFDSGSASVFAIVTDGDCVSEIVEITLTIENQISANPASADACDDGTGTANFNLTDLDGTVGGTNTVTWYEDAAATNEIIDPNNFDSGNASVFAIVTDGDCVSEIVEITLTIENQISANPASADACDDGTGIANFNLTDLDGTVGGTNTVTWYEDAAATNEIIDPNNFDSGNASVFAIVTDGDCVSEIVEITLTIENQISANPASADACDDGTGTANFNLTDLDGTVGGTNTVTWYEDAAATNEIIDPNNFDSGNASVFAIVTDGDCVSEIVEITLTIENQISANPASADACDDGTGIANFNLTDLDGTVGGTNTVTWYEDAAATNEIIDPNNFDSGNASVFAIVTDGDCTSGIVEITLTIENQFTATPASDQACDDGTGTATFDLTTLENTINNGTGNIVNFFEDAATTIPVASLLNTNTTSIYAVVENGNCPSAPVEINLMVTDLPIANPSSLDACTTGSAIGDFELSDIESDVNGGTGNPVSWYQDMAATIPITNTNFSSFATTVYAIVEGPTGCTSAPVPVSLVVLLPTSINFYDEICSDESVIVNGTVYDINMPSGIETVVGGATNGCDSIIAVLVEFFDPVIGSIEGTNSICDGQSTQITFNLSGANTYNVTYTDGINPPIVLNNVLDSHTITVSPSVTTTYTLLEVQGINIPCDATLPTNAITIDVININSEINLLADYQGFGVSCNGLSDGSIEAIPLSGTAPFSYLWDNNETTNSLQNIAAGNYIVTITDAVGCTTESSIQLSEPPAINFSLQTISPECFGDTDGAIIIEDISGVGSPFDFSLDGEIFSNIPSFPYIISSLEAGSYDLTIQDVNDCSNTEQVLINAPIENQIDLGDDITIDLGDSIQIEAIPNFEVSEIVWSNSQNGCIDCLDPFVQPFTTSEYSITVIDTFGCSTTDDIIVYVKKDRNVFIPSVFSPNGDGFNDLFFVNADQSAAIILNFRIFNRWGETIYAENNIAPNDNSMAWDGQFKGEPLNPGVFVYLVEIQFVDGRVELYKGDITLVK